MSITQTGYRSHFVHADDIADGCGQMASISASLAHMARWKECPPASKRAYALAILTLSPSRYPLDGETAGPACQHALARHPSKE